MGSNEDLAAGVVRSLSPEIDMIEDKELRQKVIDAWVLALSETEFKSIDELSCSTMIGASHYPGKTQSHHQRGVGRIARSIAEAMNEFIRDRGVQLDLDIALICGLCHDLGKPFIYDSDNQKRWTANKSTVGYPPYRHTVKGGMLALEAGLPEEIVHAVITHDVNMDGKFVRASMYTQIVWRADSAYWTILRGYDFMEEEEPIPFLQKGQYAG